MNHVAVVFHAIIMQRYYFLHFLCVSSSFVQICAVGTEKYREMVTYCSQDKDVPADHHLPWTHMPAICDCYQNNNQAKPTNMESAAYLAAPPRLEKHVKTDPLKKKTSSFQKDTAEDDRSVFPSTSTLNSSSPCFPAWCINLTATFRPSLSTPLYTEPKLPCPTTFDLLKPPVAECSCLKVKTWRPFSEVPWRLAKPPFSSCSIPSGRNQGRKGTTLIRLQDKKADCSSSAFDSST